MRLAGITSAKEAGQNPFPHKFHVTTSLQEFISTYGSIEDGSVVEDVTVSVAGRLHSIRESSAKLRFYDLRGEGVKIQVGGVRIGCLGLFDMRTDVIYM